MPGWGGGRLPPSALGNRGFAVARIQALGERDIRTVLHAGDFGIWPGPSGKAFLKAVDRACSRSGVEQIMVTPGNHEDWGRLTQLWANPKRTSLPLSLGDHISPRGYRWRMADRTFLSLGGAPSVDRERRTPGRDWWPEEMIQPDHVAHAIAGGPVDVMITHDSPDLLLSTPRVARIVQTNPLGWSDAMLDDARLGRERSPSSRITGAESSSAVAFASCSNGYGSGNPGRSPSSSTWRLPSPTTSRRCSGCGTATSWNL